MIKGDVPLLFHPLPHTLWGRDGIYNEIRSIFFVYLNGQDT
jgi:hypothetical protein